MNFFRCYMDISPSNGVLVSLLHVVMLRKLDGQTQAWNVQKQIKAIFENETHKCCNLSSRTTMKVNMAHILCKPTMILDTAWVALCK